MMKEVHDEKIEILVNAGLVVKECLTHYVPPFYKEHPPLHLLGSRVINLNSIVIIFKSQGQSSRKPRFGALGSVIGLIEGQTLHIEVLWDEPQIGLTGHRGGYLRSSIVKFNDIFNLTCGWNEYLCPREPGR